MFKINEIVISNTTPLTTNVIWVKPISFGLYKLLVYTDSGWTSVSPDESKQALINASTEYNTLHSVETLTLQQAVDKVLEADKGLGKMITYFDGTNWQFRQYAGTTLSGWNTVGNWVTVSSSTIDYTGFPLYNITTAIPLVAGQYYTATTARAAVPVNVRKRGLELLYETSAGVWYSERFIGTSVADWTLVNNWEAVLSKTYIDTQDALKIDKTSIISNFGDDETKVISQKGYTDDLKAHLPTAVYTDRVASDGGTIRDKSLLSLMYDDALNLLPNTDLWYNFECGIKTRVSGLNTYVTKVYDLSANNRDAVQPTEASQPYLVGNINSANRQAIWGYGRFVILPTIISYNNGSEWSVSLVGEQLFGLTLTGGAGSISLFGSAMYFTNILEANVIIPYNSGSVLGRTTRYVFVCKGNGEIEAWIDGKLAGKGVIADTSISISVIYSIQLKLKDFRLFNKALNKSEIEFLDAKMSAFYPQFEGVEIGNQYWEASNAMDITAPDGTVIPEVTDNAAWAALTTPAWCYYDNNEANGAIYGRIYNGYAIQKLTGSPIWRAPMSADFNQLSAFLGGDAVAGGKLKAEGLTYWRSPNDGATNESGFSAICSGFRFQTGDYMGGIGSNPNTLALATLDDSVYPIINNSAEFPAQGILGYLPNRGYSLRRLRRVPPGNLVREITSGVFSFPITSGAFKDIAIPNMYRITGVKVTSAQALTNFTLEARTSAGVLVQNLLSGKSIGAGKSIIFSVVADMEVMLQDYVVRATAVGNGGAGMEIELIIEKIKA